MSSKHSYSSDSDDEGEWSQRNSKKKKMCHNSKRPVVANVVSLEEGEISSDELDDDEDDGLDENLIGGEDDKRKLEKMSEKEREEELFKRAERRDAIQARRAVKLKLKEKRDKERAEKASRFSTGDSNKFKKQSNYSNVFTSDSEDAYNSDSSGTGGPRGVSKRKIVLEKQKEARSHKFHELIERRRQQAAKKRRLQSGSEDDLEANSQNAAVRSSAASSFSDSDADDPSDRRGDASIKHRASMSQRIFSDASDSTDSSRPDTRRDARRPSLSSLSESQRSGSSSEDDTRGRSRSPEEELVSSLEQLSRIRLSRFKMEKWVHMPFFSDLVRGCFVRINIGLNQGVPVYRCAEIVDIVETPKIYDLGDTRTNKGMVVRIGKDQSTFRLAFVSNSEFLPSEFESWMRRISEASVKPPTMSFVNRKASEIQDALTRPIKDERVVEQIIQSKKRFQRAPTNFAMRKAELLKQREQAETEGDVDAIHRLDLELEDIESQAERIERRRTLGFKSITSINQRNRMLSLQTAEEAIRKETEEAQNCKEEDPFTRVHSQPVIVTKKYLEQLRYKRTGQSHPEDSQSHTDLPASGGNSHDAPNSVLSSTPLASNYARASHNTSFSCSRLGEHTLLDNTDSIRRSAFDESLNLSTPQDSLHSIHNFEININLDLDDTGNQPCLGGAGDGSDLSKDHVRSKHNAASVGLRESVNGPSSPAVPNGLGAKKLNRRSLNLQEYKKRFGLI
ncbi:unnamed protein product [Dicrocoelium dendriticum]|nr:unnamed protein product [Dicrocoelium dendriticum]